MRKTLSIAIIFICILENIQAQKGEKSISVGPLISFPLDNTTPKFLTGLGLEVIGQYNFSKKSAILLQTSLAFYGVDDRLGYQMFHSQIFSLKGGYKYQIGASGFFTNVLAGIETESRYSLVFYSFTLGAGKRFTMKNSNFIDAGIDYIAGDTERRINVKATFSLLRRPKDMH